jgi:hypothetical protein
MKWIIPFILAGAILSQQSGCKDDPPPAKPLTELEKLPPLTNTGKQKFGCLLNGKAFVPTSTVDVYAVFQQGILTVGAKIDFPFQSVNMLLIEKGSLLEPGTYELTSPPYQKAKCYYNGCYYYEEDTIAGTITITNFDKINYIISGTFDFLTVAPGCDTLTVSNGRFDVKYV